jgi:uncharacterized protein YegL
MPESELAKRVEITTEGGPRLPCVLLLDTSGSMAGERIEAVGEGLVRLRDHLMSDAKARTTVEIAVITFNNEVSVLNGFVPPRDFNPPALTADGQTFIGEALIEALDLIEQRRKQYKSAGTPFARPIIFLLTDGQPEGEPPEVLERAQRKVRKAQQEKIVKVWPVGVGAGVDLAALGEMTGSDAKALDEAKWKELIDWLSDALKSLSASAGDVVQQKIPSTSSWEIT